MTLILDTGVLIELYRGNEEVVNPLKGYANLHSGAPSITFANFAEFYYGMLEEGEEDIDKALEFLNSFEFLPSTPAVAKKFSEIKKDLKKEGEIIPLMDIFIASIAIEKGAKLATTDSHFKRLEDLNLMYLEI